MFLPLADHCTASKLASAVPVHSLSYASAFYSYTALPCLSYPQLKIYAVLGVENIFGNHSQETCVHLAVDGGSVFVDFHNFSRTLPHVSYLPHALWQFVQIHYLHRAQESVSEVVGLFFYHFTAVIIIRGMCVR